MISRTPGVHLNAVNGYTAGNGAAAFTLRRGVKRVASGIFAVVLVTLILGFVNVKSDAQALSFQYSGGPWSYTHRNGWNRYWGGPTIGFYYAPAPVYQVPGYTNQLDYLGPNFWYADPSFEMNLSAGGVSNGIYRSTTGGFNPSYHSGVHNYHGGHSHRNGGRRH